MLPTFFSYTAISYMLFCFSPFLCLSLVSVRCCALCFCWLIVFSSIHFFLPHFPTNSLIMQLKSSTFPLSLLRSGLILFLIEETEAMNFMILYGLSLESTFEHLFFLVVQCPVAYQGLVFLYNFSVVVFAVLFSCIFILSPCNYIFEHIFVNACLKHQWCSRRRLDYL